MPCFDHRPDVVYEERLHNGENAARLCAVFTVLESKGLLGKVLGAVDWKEAGVSRTSTDRWWAKHKKLDAARREEERRRKAERKRAEKLALKPWAELNREERDLVRRFDR